MRPLNTGLTGPYQIRAEEHQGLSYNYVVRIAPAGEDPFYRIEDVVGILESEMVGPPNPGVAFTG